jgi:hypothetical protein
MRSISNTDNGTAWTRAAHQSPVRSSDPGARKEASAGQGAWLPASPAAPCIGGFRPVKASIGTSRSTASGHGSAWVGGVVPRDARPAPARKLGSRVSAVSQASPQRRASELATRQAAIQYRSPFAMATVLRSSNPALSTSRSLDAIPGTPAGELARRSGAAGADAAIAELAREPVAAHAGDPRSLDDALASLAREIGEPVDEPSAEPPLRRSQLADDAVAELASAPAPSFDETLAFIERAASAQATVA